jgi:hypothetical protein
MFVVGLLVAELGTIEVCFGDPDLDDESIEPGFQQPRFDSTRKM